jgi:hypothetical protein
MTTIALRSILRWKLDQNNCRSAIQIKDGILQVKSIINGELVYDEKSPRRLKQEMFPDFKAWEGSLPSFGNITITPYTKPQERRMRPLKNNYLAEKKIISGTDIQMFSMLCNRFSICNPKYDYKQKAFLIVGDTVKNIYVKYFQNQDWIAMSDSDKLYKTFAEIGDCLNAEGQPKITVAYRRQMISVSHLFPSKTSTTDEVSLLAENTFQMLNVS